MLIFRRFIIIFDLLFFQITKTSENAEKIVFKNIFWTRSFLTKKSKILFIVFLFFANIEEHVYFKLSMFFSFLKKMSIFISSLKRSKSDRKSFLWIWKIFVILIQKSIFQWLFMFDFNLMSDFEAATTKKLSTFFDFTCLSKKIFS